MGAGLPVIGTLKHLVETGDKIVQVEGIFSGTLSYIFNNFGPGSAFSEVVAEAKAAGYTEPDPRDDLAGTDVARKVTILARCGLAPSAAVWFRSPPACLLCSWPIRTIVSQRPHKLLMTSPGCLPAVLAQHDVISHQRV